VDRYQELGYLDMLSGFRCSGAMLRNEIINYPVQGTAFHCLLLTFIMADELMVSEGWRSKLVGQIHDSIVIDAHPDEVEHVVDSIRYIATTRLPAEWPWIIVPMEIEVDEYGVDSPWFKEK